MDLCDSRADPTFGVRSLALWHAYAKDVPMAAADLTIEGSLAPLAFTAINGYLNAGDAVNLLLAVGGCPTPPIVAGTILIVDTGGHLYLSGARLTVDCVVNDPWLSATTGWSSDGSSPVEFIVAGLGGCGSFDYVEPTSWANVKHLYR